MQKKKLRKTSKILMMFCALMLVFGAVAAVSDGVEAASILDIPVSYQAGDGPKAEEVTVPADESWNIGKHKLPDTPSCKNSDFTFVGWMEVKENSTAQGKVYDAGAEYEVTTKTTGTLTFKAVWGVKVTFDKNVDDESIKDIPAESTEYNKSYSVSAKYDDTEYYKFLGWSTEAKKNDSTPEYKVGDVIDAKLVTAPFTLYAIWEKQFLTVTYHANTGSDATDSSVTVPVDNTKYIGSGDGLVATIMGDGKLATDHVHAATMKDAIPVRTGYTFAGWATTATATKAEYQPGTKIDPMTKDIDLYAVWTSGTNATTGTTSGTTTTTKTPQTGDSDYLMLYIVMAVLSLVGIAYLCYDQKKAKASK